MPPLLHVRRENDADLPLLVWRLDVPMRTVSSGPFGGGLGERTWVMNATVDWGYGRLDPDEHVRSLAAGLALTGDGVGLLTAVDVRHRRIVRHDGVEVVNTVGVSDPTWAAGPPPAGAPAPGTINTVVFCPERLSDAALVNAVATVAEAKAQAFHDLGVEGTGTPTDAVTVLCPTTGPAAPFGGPRSRWGSVIARAVHRTVVDGIEAQTAWHAAHPDPLRAPEPTPEPPLDLPVPAP